MLAINGMLITLVTIFWQRQQQSLSFRGDTPLKKDFSEYC